MRKRTIPIKSEKRKKKEGKRKRNPMMDGIGLENGMAFCVGRNRNRKGKGKHTKEGRNYLIRYEGSASESEWHE